MPSAWPVIGVPPRLLVVEGFAENELPGCQWPLWVGGNGHFLVDAVASVSWPGSFCSLSGDIALNAQALWSLGNSVSSALPFFFN